MFKKFISLMMVLSIFTTQANAASQDSLKAAFDELNYSLTVEWDQNDKEYYNEQMKKFSNQLRDLKSKGLTNSQLIDFVKAEVKNEKVAKDLETAFNMISINKMSSEEASKYMVETMKKSYSAGASWNGEVFLYLAVGLLIVSAAITLGGSGGISNGGGNYCSNYFVCDTTCYYDFYWGYTCYDNCYYTCF